MASVPKLDKDHGFHKFIVRNQIDRDIYEEEQKVVKCLKSRGLMKQKQSQNERPTYVPPNRRRSRNDHEEKEGKEVRDLSCQEENSNQGIGDPPNDILFEMEYVPKVGNAVSVTVFSNSTPQEIVNDISSRCEITVRLKEALFERILKEIEEGKQ